MSLSLNKVELTNFRNHEHFEFTPKADGITAICGKNGTGKSSIVNAISFALFGTKPSGVRKMSDLARYGISSDDPCGVVVELGVDGVDMRVERVLVGKSHNSAECSVYENGSLVAGPAPSFATDYIKKRIRMDEKGFMSAVLVEQKQVDHLITASRNERGAVIEKLTGIASLTKALEKARERARDAKKLVDNMDVNPDDVPRLEKELTGATEQVEKHQAQYDKLSERRESTQEKMAQAKDLRDRAQRAYDKCTRQATELEVDKERLKEIGAELEQAVKRKDAQRKKVDALDVKSDLDLKTVQKSLKRQRNDLELRNSQIATLKEQKRTHEDTIKRATEFLEKYKIPRDIKRVEQAYVIKTTEVDTLTYEAETKSAKIKSLTDTADRFKKAARALSNKDGKCPTCLQSVDEPKEVVDKLMGEAKDLIEQAEKLAQEVGILRAKSDTMRVQDIELLKNAKLCVSTLDDAVVKLEEVNGHLDKLNEIVSEVRERVDYAEDMVSKLTVLESEQERLKQLHQDVVALDRKHSELMQKIEASEKWLKSAKSPTVAQLDKLRVSAEKAIGAYDEVNEKYHDKRLELQQWKSNQEKLQKDLDDAKRELESHEIALSTLQEATASEMVVSQFRQDRITNAIPQITSHASQLISQFTGGKFVSLEMSDTFIPSVIDNNGVKVPVSSLSGGEMSAAALALRTAISLMLTGGASGLIILDEVLVSQDLERSAAILYTIKEVCRGQVIMIAHSSIVEDVADEIITIE